MCPDRSTTSHSNQAAQLREASGKTGQSMLIMSLVPAALAFLLGFSSPRRKEPLLSWALRSALFLRSVRSGAEVTCRKPHQAAKQGTLIFFKGETEILISFSLNQSEMGLEEGFLGGWVFICQESSLCISCTSRAGCQSATVTLQHLLCKLQAFP